VAVLAARAGQEVVSHLLTATMRFSAAASETCFLPQQEQVMYESIISSADSRSKVRKIRRLSAPEKSIDGTFSRWRELQLYGKMFLDHAIGLLINKAHILAQ